MQNIKKDQKKILIISPYYPYPSFKNGCCNTVFNFLKTNEAQKYDITILHFETNCSNENNIPNTECKVNYVNIDGTQITENFNKKILIRPRCMINYKFKKMTNIDVGEYDYIIFASIIVVGAYNKFYNLKKSTKLILFAADSIAMYYFREGKTTHSIFRKAYNYLQIKFIKDYELTYFNIFDSVIYVSDIDCEYVKKYVKSDNLHTARLGVRPYNLNKRELKHVSSSILNIGFSGNMDYSPNIEATNFIINEIMPLLNKHNINYKIHIIGKNPNQEWYNSSEVLNNRLVITGFIDDMFDYLSKIDIYISPLLSGSGMKNKVLEALSVGLPLIASNISVDGIDGLIDNYNFISSGNNPEEWVNKILSLGTNPELQFFLSKNGRKLVSEYYSWERFAQDLLYT